jgi:hypothetical protein
VIVLDENVPAAQREQLHSWRIHARQIGLDVGQAGMSDEDVLPLLQRLRQPTFFTRDSDFDRRELCHGRYCLVYLEVSPAEVASYARRVLRHRRYNTKAKRMGCVIRAGAAGLTVWHLHADEQQTVTWNAR